MDVCGRCGAFLCAECLELVDESTSVCGPCARLLAAERSRGRGWPGLTLSSLGLLGLLAGALAGGRSWLPLGLWAVAVPLGLSGLVASRRAMKALRRGLSPPRALRVARLGWMLGLVHAALVLAMVAGALVALFTPFGGSDP